MAKWLNALLAGPYTVSVSRDGVEVNPSDVGAALTVASGVMTLQTPADEGHQWDVRITPTLNTAVPMRFRSMSMAHPPGINSAQAFTNSPGQGISLATSPTVSPDPATFALPAAVAGISIVENGPA